MAFGSKFQDRGESALAISAYHRAADLAKEPDLADGYDRDRIDRALALLSGMDSADVEFMQISKLQEDDPHKKDRFVEAAMNYQTDNRSQALRFIHEAARLQEQEIVKIVGSMPLSGSHD